MALRLRHEAARACGVDVREAKRKTGASRTNMAAAATCAEAGVRSRFVLRFLGRGLSDDGKPQGTTTMSRC